MLEFCGQEQCMVDTNGRLKLSSNVLRDYQRYTDGPVVLHCLPEGSIAVYPPKTWEAMRGYEMNRAELAARSAVYRRNLRRFGAMSSSAVISNQGRITIPPAYRDYANLSPNTEVLVVGCEIGIEIWNMQSWLQESELIQKHIVDKTEQEMNADLSIGQQGMK